MPVPLSVTNPQGAGLQAAANTSLPTEGPFERMKRLAAEAAQVTQATTAQETSNAPVVPEPQGNEIPASEHALITSQLSFSYPDIGAFLQPKRCYIYLYIAFCPPDLSDNSAL
jgi:hypothetical protein